MKSIKSPDMHTYMILINKPTTSEFISQQMEILRSIIFSKLRRAGCPEIDARGDN